MMHSLTEQAHVPSPLRSSILARASWPRWSRWLPPAATLAEGRAITLQGDGGDAWTFEKKSRVRCRTAGATRSWSPRPGPRSRPGMRTAVLAPSFRLQEGENEVRAICRADGADRSVSEPQHWRVRLRDAPKAWIRIIPAENGVVLNAGPANRPLPGVRRSSATNGGAPRKSGTAGDGRGRPARRCSGRRPIELSLRTPGIDGEYQITLRVTDALGRTDESTAAILVENGEPRAADLAQERPAWLNGAVVYGVAPFFFGPTAALTTSPRASTPSRPWARPCCGCPRSPAPRKATSAMP